MYEQYKQILAQTMHACSEAGVIPHDVPLRDLLNLIDRPTKESKIGWKTKSAYVAAG
jgi:hypothetical protein